MHLSQCRPVQHVCKDATTHQKEWQHVFATVSAGPTEPHPLNPNQVVTTTKRAAVLAIPLPPPRRAGLKGSHRHAQQPAGCGWQHGRAVSALHGPSTIQQTTAQRRLAGRNAALL